MLFIKESAVSSEQVIPPGKLIVMEEQSVHDPQPTLSIDAAVRSHLKQIARWTQFLAIAAMILLSLALFGILCLAMLGTVSSVVSNKYYDRLRDINSGGTLLMICTILLFSMVGTYFLYRFSSQVRRALYGEDQKALENSFSVLKIHWVIGVVLAVILMVFNVIKNLLI
jgi:cytochrome b561